MIQLTAIIVREITQRHQVSLACNYRKIFYKQDVRVVFSRARMRSSNSAHMNKSNFTTENIV